MCIYKYIYVYIYAYTYIYIICVCVLARTEIPELTVFERAAGEPGRDASSSVRAEAEARAHEEAKEEPVEPAERRHAGARGREARRHEPSLRSSSTSGQRRRRALGPGDGRDRLTSRAPAPERRDRRPRRRRGEKRERGDRREAAPPSSPVRAALPRARDGSRAGAAGSQAGAGAAEARRPCPFKEQNGCSKVVGDVWACYQHILAVHYNNLGDKRAQQASWVLAAEAFPEEAASAEQAPAVKRQRRKPDHSLPPPEPAAPPCRARLTPAEASTARRPADPPAARRQAAEAAEAGRPAAEPVEARRPAVEPAAELLEATRPALEPSQAERPAAEPAVALEARRLAAEPSADPRLATLQSFFEATRVLARF